MAQLALETFLGADTLVPDKGRDANGIRHEKRTTAPPNHPNNYRQLNLMKNAQQRTAHARAGGWAVLAVRRRKMYLLGPETFPVSVRRTVKISFML